MKTKRTMAQSLVRVLLVTAFVLAIPLVANPFVDGEGWSLFDFALVGGLIMGTGLLYELATRSPGSTTSAVIPAALAAIGGAAAVLGEFDDAPGLILIGFVLVVTAVGVSLRTVRRAAGTADGHADPTGPA